MPSLDNPGSRTEEEQMIDAIPLEPAIPEASKVPKCNAYVAKQVGRTEYDRKLKRWVNRKGLFLSVWLKQGGWFSIPIKGVDADVAPFAD